MSRIDAARLAELRADPEAMTVVERALLTFEVLDDLKSLRGELGVAIEQAAAAADVELVKLAVRDEVASLCRLVVRRLREVPRPRSDPLLAALLAVFDEALQERQS